MSERFNKALAEWAKNATLKNKFMALHPFDKELLESYQQLQRDLKAKNDRQSAT